MTESQNSMTFGQFFMFHDFSMTIFIFQVFQSLWEPCLVHSNKCDRIREFSHAMRNLHGEGVIRFDVVPTLLRQSAVGR